MWVKFNSRLPFLGGSRLAAVTMLQFERYTLDIARHSLRAADRKIALRPKNFEVLRYLVENPDRLVTKEELLTRRSGRMSL
jgi:DNA-binding response OmpR family regulator